jgi:hypothetical protein
VALSLLLAPVNQAGAVAAPPREPLDEPKGDFVNQGYWGTLTEVTKDSVTVQFDGQKDRKPRTFRVSETLAAGKTAMYPRLTFDRPDGYAVGLSVRYRLSDVKVGDWVIIIYARVDGVYICDHIGIQKRPGGRVPPLPDEAEEECLAWRRKYPGLVPEYIRYHEYWNAYWDLEDKGIPYPEKFGKNRRWPAAPMPREVKPGPARSP